MNQNAALVAEIKGLTRPTAFQQTLQTIESEDCIVPLSRQLVTIQFLLKNKNKK